MPSGILVHPVIWPQCTMAEHWGVVTLYGRGSWVPSNTMSPRLRYEVVLLYVHPFGHNSHGPKTGGGLCPLFGGAGSQSNTMWPGLRPTSVPSGILIHPAVWPQQTWAKNWGLFPFFWGGELGPHLAQCGLDQGPPPCQVPS